MDTEEQPCKWISQGQRLSDLPLFAVLFRPCHPIRRLWFPIVAAKPGAYSHYSQERNGRGDTPDSGPCALKWRLRVFGSLFNKKRLVHAKPLVKVFAFTEIAVSLFPRKVQFQSTQVAALCHSASLPRRHPLRRLTWPRCWCFFLDTLKFHHDNLIFLFTGASVLHSLK